MTHCREEMIGDEEGEGQRGMRRGRGRGGGEVEEERTCCYSAYKYFCSYTQLAMYTIPAVDM